MLSEIKRRGDIMNMWKMLFEDMNFDSFREGHIKLVQKHTTSAVWMHPTAPDYIPYLAPGYFLTDDAKNLDYQFMHAVEQNNIKLAKEIYNKIMKLPTVIKPGLDLGNAPDSARCKICNHLGINNQEIEIPDEGRFMLCWNCHRWLVDKIVNRA